MSVVDEGRIPDIEFADPVADREAEEEATEAYLLIRRWAEPFPNDDITRAIDTVIKHKSRQIEALSKRLGIEHTVVEKIRDELTAKKTMLREKATQWARDYNAVSNRMRAVEAVNRRLIEAARALLKEMDHVNVPSIGVLAKLRAEIEGITEPNESTKETH